MTKKPAPFDYLPGHKSFLEPRDADAGHPDTARCVVIPFGLEASVSYGGGTSKGPQAILDASHQLELFDEELWCEPHKDYGIAAIKAPKIKKKIDKALEQLEAIVARVLDEGRFPFVLGGEHSLTVGAIRPFAAKYPDLVVLQFDAHADLRDGYQGEHYSHAAAMRRVLDNATISLVSVGVRAISSGEVEFFDANRHRIHMHFAKDQARWDIAEIVKPLRGKPVYVTFDIDALDGAVMPATGTPTPGGLSYLHALDILRAAADVSTIVGADLVELAPLPGLHVFDYTAAHLAYKMMSYALSGTRPKTGSPQRG